MAMFMQDILKLKMANVHIMPNKAFAAERKKRAPAEKRR